MDSCIFCSIVQGKIPAEKVFENENFLAFLDIRPQSAGHTLVIPKQHYRWVWDVPQAGEYFEIVKKIALAQKKAFDIELVQGKVYGEEIPHAHFWVFPDPASTKDDKNDLTTNAQKIREIFKKGEI